MKKLNFLFIFAFVALCAGFTSCDKPDQGKDNNTETPGSNISEDKLVGTWQATRREGWIKDSEYPQYEKEFDEVIPSSDEFTITFNADHTTLDSEGEPGQWILNGSKLSLSYDDEPGYFEVHNILKLTDNELIIEYHEKDEMYEAYMQITFKRK